MGSGGGDRECEREVCRQRLERRQLGCHGRHLGAQQDELALCVFDWQQPQYAITLDSDSIIARLEHASYCNLNLQPRWSARLLSLSLSSSHFPPARRQTRSSDSRGFSRKETTGTIEDQGVCCAVRRGAIQGWAHRYCLRKAFLTTAAESIQRLFARGIRSDNTYPTNKPRICYSMELSQKCSVARDIPNKVRPCGALKRLRLFKVCTGSSATEINDLLTDELSMTTVALKTHPKVYWIWSHRRWCLENTPDGPGTDTEGDMNGWRQTNWDREMFVVDKMLDADSRNCKCSCRDDALACSPLSSLVHAWDYRRYCLANMPIARSATAELAYTTRKIEANFSNFSAWHQRSKVLSTLWASEKLDYSKSKEEGKSGGSLGIR